MAKSGSSATGMWFKKAPEPKAPQPAAPGEPAKRPWLENPAPRLLLLVVRYPRLLAVIIGLSVVSALVTAPAPYLGKIIIDEIIFKQMNAEKLRDVSGLLGVPLAVWMLGAVVACGLTLKLLSTMLQGWQSHYILQITRNTLYDIRTDTALRLMGAPQKYFETLEPGRVASRLTNDVNNMDGAIFTILRFLISSILTVLVVVAFMLAINPTLTAVVLITVPLTAFFSWFSYRKLHAFSKAESDRAASLTATAAETFGAMKIIRVFGAEPFFLRRIQDRSEALRFEGIRHWTVFHTINGLLGLLGALGGEIFLFVGGVMAIYGHITFGEFFAFYGYQGMLWGPINMLLNAGMTLQTGAASAEKVQELRDVEQEPYLERPLPAEPLSDTPFVGEVRAENLSFAYHGDDPVLQGVDLAIKPGTMNALVGQSGSGKTTFANLLTGLYLPTGGKLLIDGVDVRQWDLRRLRRSVGVVLQDAVMFNDTVRGNLCLGTDYPDERIWSALRAAHLDQVVRDMPQGLDTPIGVSGTRLSGGQRQRLAIARVFLKDPKFIILDEATSALDSETEKAIQRSFDALLAGRTSVVIAHRLSTIFRADQIVVLRQGKVVEVGTHEELAEREGGHYRRLFEAQVEGMVPMSGATRRRGKGG